MIFDGQRERADDGDDNSRISHVREGRVVGAWRAVDGNVGYALLDVDSPAMISRLLSSAFPTARHIDVAEVVLVNSTAEIVVDDMPRTATGESRATGS
jgi:hypothetical protein